MQSPKVPLAAQALHGRLGRQPARGPHDASARVGAAAAQEEPADRRARAHVVGAGHWAGHVQLGTVQGSCGSSKIIIQFCHIVLRFGIGERNYRVQLIPDIVTISL